MKSKDNALGLFPIIAWAINLAYGLWYLITGWSQQNAIMAFCSGLNDPALGWFKYVCGHGVLNFVAGYLAVFPIVAPIVVLIASLIHKSVSKGAEKAGALFGVLLVAIAAIACFIYSSLYMMEQHPLVSGLFILGAIFAGLASCVSVYTIIIVVE